MKNDSDRAEQDAIRRAEDRFLNGALMVVGLIGFAFIIYEIVHL
jgi:hypothetical protein